MRKLITYLSLAIVGLCSPLHLAAEKSNVPLIADGAWSLNSQPSAVYYNGNTFFAYLNSSKSIVVACYNHEAGTLQEKVVSSGYADDFCSPALTVRGNGQLLLFAQNNQREDGWYVWRSNNPEDITSWSASAKQTGYGISATTPFIVGQDLVVFWRQKNSFGYSLFNNVADKTAALPGPVKRAGCIGTDIGNNYAHREEIPQMRAVQAEDGSIHAVITHLGTGLTYQNSTVHYFRTEPNEARNAMNFYRADNSQIAGMSVKGSDELDTIAAGWGADKVWAYDIALDSEGKPMVLYDAFRDSGEGMTTGHTYCFARWNGEKWERSVVANVEEGLPIAAYSAIQGCSFVANTYRAGGMCFGQNDKNRVYISRKVKDGTFELFCYETTDGGSTWTEKSALTHETPSNQVNIRPITVANAKADYPVDLLWMQGTYTSPTDYKTAIMGCVEKVLTTGISFEKEDYEWVLGNQESVQVFFAPLGATDREYTLISSNPEVVSVQDDGSLLCHSVGTATLTATLKSDPTITATCQVSVVAQSVYTIFKERILSELLIEDATRVDQRVASALALLNDDGSFSDVDYASTARTDWPPMVHLDRMLEMAQVYTCPTSTYYESEGLKTKLDAMLTYWENRKPTSNNWYQNEIGEPQRMGKYLILMQCRGKEAIPTGLFDQAIARLKNKGGNPGSQTGANRVDVALHWMYRACLTEDADLLQQAMDYIYSPIAYTEGAEGIQYDNAFTQHGKQLHISSYGKVFLSGLTKACSYAAGTKYAVSGERLEILRNLVNTYMQVHRGEYVSFNVIGRASSRTGGVKVGDDVTLRCMMALDPQNAAKYEAVLARMTGIQPASYEVAPVTTHFFCTDYTLQTRPNYTVDLRLVSTRTARNEYLKDNGEGIKQYFMSDGGMNILVDGDEYYNIFPTWNYAKVPGVTCPEMPQIPQANTYIKMGQSAFAGGVTDSVTAVSAYRYTDSEYSVNSSAYKSWFFFDNEVVCLGSGVRSTSGYQMNTTVNQCLWDGEVVASTGDQVTPMAEGSYNLENDLQWVWHDKVGYFFPSGGTVQLCMENRQGRWTDINTNYSDELVTKPVFTLSFNHGVDPTEGRYAYIIVPGLESADAAKAYGASDIAILINSDSIQAVYHKKSKTYGIVFFRAGAFRHGKFAVEADAGCLILAKNVDQPAAQISVSDPTNSGKAITLGVEISAVEGRRQLVYQQTAPYAGRSTCFAVDENTPAYAGMDRVCADRSGWVVTTSIEGPTDSNAEVGGDNPQNIVDDSTRSSFLFVKPGKTLGGISAPADYIPSFTVDMQENHEFSFVTYRHRDYSNTVAFLRAKAISIYGRSGEEDDFVPIIENVSLSTSVAENKIQLPETVNYRYVKVEITDYDTSSGSTIQVSDFNIGSKVLSDIPDVGDVVPVETIYAGDQALRLENSVVKRGKHVIRILGQGKAPLAYRLYTLSGTLYRSGQGAVIPTDSLIPGMYLVVATSADGRQRISAKVVVQ